MVLFVNRLLAGFAPRLVRPPAHRRFGGGAAPRDNGDMG